MIQKLNRSPTPCIEGIDYAIFNSVYDRDHVFEKKVINVVCRAKSKHVSLEIPSVTCRVYFIANGYTKLTRNELYRKAGINLNTPSSNRISTFNLYITACCRYFTLSTLIFNY